MKANTSIRCSLSLFFLYPVFVEAVDWNGDWSWSSATPAAEVQQQQSKPESPWFLPAPPQRAQSSFFYSAPARAQTSARQPQSTWRINVGSATPYTDSNRHTWQPDTHYVTTGGTAINKCFNNPFPSLMDYELYCSYRDWIYGGPSTGVLSFAVPSGTYSIKILLSETSATIGERVVDVFLQGQVAWPNLDVAKEVRNTIGVYTLAMTRPIHDGAVTIEIVAQRGGRPILAGIEIVPAARRRSLRHSTNVRGEEGEVVAFS